MLTLITGTPGAGKTAYAVAQLEQFQKDNPSRQIFVMGIPELLIEHEPCPPVSEWTIEKSLPEDPTILEEFFTFPDGALVVIDEAQKIYRPRANSSKVPAIVSALERHRHQGLDFWLITQSPSLIDANVRRLIGRHIHIRQNWAGRKLFEWSETHDPESRTDRDAAAKRNYRLPKTVFGRYKSASIHVQTKRRIPYVVYVLSFSVVILAVAGYFIRQRIQNYQSEALPAPESASVPDRFVVSPALTTQPSARASGVTADDYTPRIATRPETAPLYDGIRQAQVMPIVAGCITYVDYESNATCQCYTQQGTDAFLDDMQCREWLRKPPFNPWQSARRESVKTEFDQVPPTQPGPEKVSSAVP